MTRRQLSALFEETLVGEPPLRDLVAGAIARGRAERRRAHLVAAVGLAAAAVVAFAVLPAHGPWRSALDERPADEAPALTLPGRFLPVPQIAEDAEPDDGSVVIDEPWAAVKSDPYSYTDGEEDTFWTATTFADAVGQLLPDKGGRRSGVPLGFDGPPIANQNGELPSRWVETWQADRDGVTGLWVQQWTLWPRVWQYCTAQDTDCRTQQVGKVTLVSYRTQVKDVVTREPVDTWVARAATEKDLMIVVMAGPRTRAGVSTGSSRPEPLLARAKVEELARQVAELGY